MLVAVAVRSEAKILAALLLRSRIQIQLRACIDICPLYLCIVLH
jgi:hypothetical protein